MTLRSRAVDAVFGGLELAASLYDFVRNLRKPGPEHDGETDFPLTQRCATSRPPANDGRKEPPQRR